MRFNKIKYLMVLSFILSFSLFTQTENSANLSESKIWFGAGVVLGNFDYGGNGGGFGVDLNYNTGRKIYKARCLYMKEVIFDLFGGAPPANSVWESGLLFGLISPNGKKRISLAAGISYVGGTKISEEYDDEYESSPYVKKNISTIGFPVEVQVLYAFNREEGGSITLFGDINSENNFVGVTVSFILGRLR